MAKPAFVGIDAGTQGMSVLIADESMEVLAVGEASYSMVEGLPAGQFEQRPCDWLAAMKEAMVQAMKSITTDYEIAAIGISGQMHGEVLCDDAGESLAPARLWCDARNEEEGAELTTLLETKMPKRITAARWLWTTRNRGELAAKTKHLTTPAGWLAFQLTGEWNLGIGEASGMFPIDQATLSYDVEKLKRFASVAATQDYTPLAKLLPNVKVAGEHAGTLNEAGAALLGLPPGIPVAPAEGDQPAGMAGSLIGEAGMVAVSFGTSVAANSVGDRAFQGVHTAVDHFCAVDGRPINMVMLRNGTTFMNSVVEMVGSGGDDATEANRDDAFAAVMPKLLAASADCGGVLAIPFIDDEPGLGVSHGGQAAIVGLNGKNMTAGNAAKAALLATVFNLRLGSEVLDEQDFPRTELLLSGGLVKTAELGQIIADALRVPVRLLDNANEGTACGSALLAKFRLLKMSAESMAGDDPTNWTAFLKKQTKGSPRCFQPDRNASSIYDQMYNNYKSLLASRGLLPN